MSPNKVRTCLWFDGNAKEAAEFYVSLLPDSEVTSADPVMVHFTLGGTPYQGLNGGPRFKFNEAASISVTTENQEETDRLWNALTANGGCEGKCGWLKDRYGLSWQIVPKVLGDLLGSNDHEAARRAQEAMLKMGKIDIEVLQRAFDG